MKQKTFVKNDNGFICECCGAKVLPLGYTSRDHCNVCLASLHIDIFPGDRQNDCKGILKPIDVDLNNKKGYVIKYRCMRCGQYHNNKSAQDDSFDAIISVSNKTYDNYLQKLLNIGK